MLVIHTQYRENYGTEDRPYLKNKGGQEYKVKNVPSNENITTIIENINNIEYSNSMSQQFVIFWSIQDDDYLSWFEKSQLEYDGKILFAEPVIEYEDLCKETVWIESETLLPSMQLGVALVVMPSKWSTTVNKNIERIYHDWRNDEHLPITQYAFSLCIGTEGELSWIGWQIELCLIY